MFKFLLLFVFVFSASGPLGAAPVLSDLQSAIMDEDYAKAKTLARDLLIQHLPSVQQAEVRYYLGLSHLRTGEYTEAHDIFRKILSDRSADDVADKAAVGLIDVLYAQGEYEKVLREATKLVSRRRASDMMSLVLLRSARANLKLGRWNQAREALEQVVAQYPDSFEAPVARQLLDEKQYFSVQVGAFGDEGRAHQLVRDLNTRGEYAYIIEAKAADGRVLYRVRVGKLTSLEEARGLESRLSGFGYPTLIYP
ncbi:MAG: tetratricopeptide repeat protein [Elusimicrobia bacterium]|nr:tetratricopeptide repeat protein [Elusimicrobiota bacterium]